MSRALAPDYDLYRVENRWRVEGPDPIVSVLRAEPKLGDEELEHAARVLFVGTSFMLTFAEVMQPT